MSRWMFWSLVMLGALMVAAGCGQAAVLTATTEPTASKLQKTATPRPNPAATLVPSPSATVLPSPTQRVVSFVPVRGRPSLIEFYEEG